jgi:uncharacterized protein YjbI with pentapeptide repeats
MDAGQLMAELDRVALLVPDDAPATPTAAHDAIGRAITCLFELVKFLPPGAEVAPPEAFTTEAGRLDHKLRPTRYRRTWLEAQTQHYLGLDQRYRATIAIATPAAESAPVTIGKLDSKALEAHLQWVRRRGEGAGKLVLRGLDAHGARIGPKELSGAILIEVNLDGADLSFATLASAQLEQVSFKRAALASATLEGSRIADCAFDGAAMTLTKLGDAALEGCTFGDAELDRSTWYRAQVRRCDLRGAHLGNAALDRAVFVECDLRGAELALRTPQPLGTTFFTRFERCDLRGTTWAGRNLARAELIDCKLGGASGRPELTGTTTIERADLSAAGDGTHLLDGNAALTALGWT